MATIASSRQGAERGPRSSANPAHGERDLLFEFRQWTECFDVYTLEAYLGQLSHAALREAFEADKVLRVSRRSRTAVAAGSAYSSARPSATSTRASPSSSPSPESSP